MNEQGTVAGREGGQAAGEDQGRATVPPATSALLTFGDIAQKMDLRRVRLGHFDGFFEVLGAEWKSQRIKFLGAGAPAMIAQIARIVRCAYTQKEVLGVTAPCFALGDRFLDEWGSTHRADGQPRMPAAARVLVQALGRSRVRHLWRPLYDALQSARVLRITGTNGTVSLYVDLIPDPCKPYENVLVEIRNSIDALRRVLAVVYSVLATYEWLLQDERAERVDARSAPTGSPGDLGREELTSLRAAMTPLVESLNVSKRARRWLVRNLPPALGNPMRAQEIMHRWPYVFAARKAKPRSMSSETA